ncbi:MAG: hypothetical protein EHM70_12720 [Chloroflexota bacterium]|nr:MAG: hypothetical protein EHM70_12720 [Chloroflexota bacterium]
MADIETDVTVTGQKEITVDGVAMIQVDMTGKEGDQDVVVRAVMGMVSSTHEFSMFGVAPQSRWDSEVGPIFEAVLDSISFFEPSVPEIGLPEITPEPPQELAELRQWAFFAEGSSEYGNPDWAASQVQGEPDTFDCGDQVTAWATSDKTSTDWVDLYYETPVIPTEVNIYQTYNPGYITLVELRDEAGGIYTVYEAEASPLDECPDILAIPVTNVMNEVVSIRITMDQSSIASESIWSEIDAVELVGLSMGDFGALPDSYNFEDIPVYEGAEEVMSFDGMLSFLVSADRAAVRDFYLEELPKLGWQLDLDENGNCVDENRCMGQFFNYDDPENLTWGFIQGEDAQLNLTIINEGDKLRVSITL